MQMRAAITSIQMQCRETSVTWTCTKLEFHLRHDDECVLQLLQQCTSLLFITRRASRRTVIKASHANSKQQAKSLSHLHPYTYTHAAVWSLLVAECASDIKTAIIFNCTLSVRSRSYAFYNNRPYHYYIWVWARAFAMRDLCNARGKPS
jgi:hypothetical protein